MEIMDRSSIQVSIKIKENLAKNHEKGILL